MLKAHMGSSWLRPAGGRKGINAYEKAKNNLERHFKEHGNELGYDDIGKYQKAVYNIIKTPAAVYVERSKSGKTVYHFMKGGKVVVSYDDTLQIRNFYPYNEKRWRSYERAGLIKLR